jgi:AcrR family transcriptional regulator
MARPADPHAKIDLLRAAEDVFVARGVDHAKVEEITERAGRSKGAFYLHFHSKEEAFRQIIESFLARLATCIHHDDGRLGEDPGLTALPGLFEEWMQRDCDVFEFLWQNRRILRLVFEGGKSAEFAYLIDAFAERTRMLTKEYLAWGMRQGIYRPDLDVEVGSLMIAGAYDRVARDLVKKDHKPDLKALFAEMQRFLFRGLLTDEAAKMFDRQVKKAGRT